MFSNWHENVKPKMLEYYEAIRSKYGQLKEIIKLALEADLEKQFEKIKAPEEEKDKLRGKIALIKDVDFN